MHHCYRLFCMSFQISGVKKILQRGVCIIQYLEPQNLYHRRQDYETIWTLSFENSFLRRERDWFGAGREDSSKRPATGRTGLTNTGKTKGVNSNNLIFYDSARRVDNYSNILKRGSSMFLDEYLVRKIAGLEGQESIWRRCQGRL